MATLVFHPAMMQSNPVPEPGSRAYARVHAGNPVEATEASAFTIAIAGAVAPVMPDRAPAASGGVLGIAARRSTVTDAPASTPMLHESRTQASVGNGDPARVAAAAEQAHLATLATACLQGETRAWESLVRSQQRRVYGLCYRFTGSAAEAEDLTQDVFLKVYRNLRSFDAAKASFGVWLAALTRNLLVDHYRRSRLERASDSLDEPFAGEEDGVTRADRLPDTRMGQERHVAGVELRAKVQAALADITPELREAVILRDLEDMDYREIAEVLGIPQGTVKSRISRGRAELARLLRGMEGQVM